MDLQLSDEEIPNVSLRDLLSDDEIEGLDAVDPPTAKNNDHGWMQASPEGDPEESARGEHLRQGVIAFPPYPIRGTGSHKFLAVHRSPTCS